MAFWREASTLLFALRPRLAGGSTKVSSGLSRATDYKILMLQRSAQSSFMPLKLVFPGGMVNDADHSGDWHAVFEKVMGCRMTEMIYHLSSTGSHFSHNLHNSWTLPPDVAYRICAIRETFEESGLLLATNRDLLSSSYEPFIATCSADDLTKAAGHRHKVDKKPEYFMQMCEDLGVFPNIWALYEWRNWLTPVFFKVFKPPAKPNRFNTLFYMCCVDCDAVPQTSADEVETTKAKWHAPGTFLEDYMNHDIDQPSLAPPQIYELHSLTAFKSMDILLTECKKRRHLAAERWMPVRQLCRDAVLILLPGDYMYPPEPDYDGTQDILPPLLSSSVDELTDSACRLNRMVFNTSETLHSVSSVDKLMKKATVICNI